MGRPCVISIYIYDDRNERMRSRTAAVEGTKEEKKDGERRG